MHLEIHSNPPGFKVNMLTLYSQKKEAEESSFLNGETNNLQEIPIKNYKIQSNGIMIQPYGSPSDYYEFINASKLKSPFSEATFIVHHLKEKKFLL